ncbi:MAG: Mth938-like domain-containing protein [Gammaproteobacteria bacterium]|nr:Mth938-like domain-containing protein [Gammaproteobacteria bacterium]
MQLDAEPGSGNYIQSVTAEMVRINGQSFRCHVIVSAGRIITDWEPRPIAELRVEDFQAAIDDQPETILFGTGAKHRFVSNFLLTAIMSQGIGFEVMGTAAACRTYNLLLGEGRRVVAALLLPEPG